MTFAVADHTRPSRPSANRMRVPIIRIALSSGGSEISDSTVMICPPRSPARRCAASLAGCVARASSAIGRIASKAILTSR